ncbi:hypothetical protein [Roseimaritima ulvae]|uniref:TerB family tellurite resistance protein n=1 Tax=Roseimaritima ulvae TaxID=980254 RepID=A0A5B9QP22_9BACT|nr:hypothetical protein [Roseimaritima ulvae]QEG40768.1 hypothetical protein UC8_27850 [Roseimaritima ulvae]
MSDQLHSSERQLNEKFYADVDEKLVKDLREDLGDDVDARALAAATGIVDSDLVTELVRLGVSAETLAAFRMIPLLHVAWCDGQLQPSEREVLLDAACRRNMARGSAAYRVLDEWMERPPRSELMTAWKKYLEEMCDGLSSTAISVLRSEIVGQAEMVAQAAGGILGIAATSKAEKKALETIRTAFNQAAA